MAIFSLYGAAGWGFLGGNSAAGESAQWSVLFYWCYHWKTDLRNCCYYGKSNFEKTVRHPRESVIAKITSHNGIPTVIFNATDYYRIMADECKFTIVGRFLMRRPQIDQIWSSFKELFAIRGSDSTNEDDFNMVWYRRVIETEGLQMWLHK